MYHIGHKLLSLVIVTSNYFEERLDKNEKKIQKFLKNILSITKNFEVRDFDDELIKN